MKEKKTNKFDIKYNELKPIKIYDDSIKLVTVSTAG